MITGISVAFAGNNQLRREDWLMRGNTKINYSTSDLLGKEVFSAGGAHIGIVSKLNWDSFEVTKRRMHMPFLARKRFIGFDQIEEITANHIKLCSDQNLAKPDIDQDNLEDIFQDRYFTL